MRRLLIPALATAAVLALAGCATTETPGAEPTDHALKVAIVLGGVANDGGFNQYAVDAAKPLVDSGDITTQVRESVENPADAEPIFRQFANEGFDLIIGWGLGFSDSVIKVAKELPDTHFIATGSADILDKATDNLETWTFSTTDSGYLSGWVAGKTGLSPIASIDGISAPFNEATNAAFSVGLVAANPAAVELPRIFTGSWEDPQLANQATKAQIDLGAKLIVTGAEGYSSGVIAAAKAGGVATIGASNQTSADAKSVNIGLVKLDWTPTLKEIVQRLQDGKFGNYTYTSTIANHGLVFADLNLVDAAPDLPADIDKQITELAAKLASGEITIDLGN